MNGRISRTELYMNMAILYSRRSTCLRASVGAVLIRGGRPIAAGYNGAPPGLPHCLDEGCLELDGLEGCQRTIHAEANAIAFAANYGISTKGASLYATHSPCRKCAELLISAGVHELVFTEEYRATPWALLSQGGIRWERWPAL